MSIALRGVGSHATTEGASAKPGVPTGTEKDDILLMLAASSRDDAIPLPEDWFSLASAVNAFGITDLTVRLMWKRAEEGETAPTVLNTGANSLSCRIAGFSGALDEGDPWVAVSGDWEDSNPVKVGGLTTPVDGCMVLFAVFLDNDFSISSWSGTTPAFVEIFDSLFNAVGGPPIAKDSTIALAGGIMEVAGATGDRIATPSSEATSGAGYLLALTPLGPEEPEEDFWEGDSLDSSKFTKQEKEAGRITVVTDPALKCPGTTHDTTFRFENKDGDFLSEAEEEAEPPTTRAEIMADEPPFILAQDVTRWYRQQLRFAEDYDIVAEGFRTIMQFKHTDDSGAPADLYTWQDELRAWSVGEPSIATVVPGGAWLDVVLEAVWSHDPEKALQRLYLNGELIGEKNVPLKAGEGIYLKWGNYKEASIPGGVIYIGGLVAAKTKSELGPFPIDPSDPTAFKPRHLPPLELDVEVETPDGIHRLPCDSRIASKRPRAINFSTQRGDGFGPGGCSFDRPIFKDYPDISPLDTWRFVGRNDDVAYEGRLRSRPGGNDPSQQININLAGWMTYLNGRRIPALIVDRRSGSWGGPSMARRERLLELNRSLEASVDTAFRDKGSLAAGIVISSGRLNSVYAVTGEAWFYGGGEAIGKLLYDSKQISTFSSPDEAWHILAALAEDDIAKEGVDEGPDHNRVDAIDQILEASDDKKRYALIQVRRDPGEGEDANTDAFLNLAVVGDHDLTIRGTGAEAGFWLSDIIRYILQRYYPKIDTSGIQHHTYPVKQATYHDSKADGHQAIEQLNGLAGWETNVWEYRRYHFHPADLSRYDWVIRTTDPGVRVTFEGPSIEHFANGVEVTYDDFYGVQHTLYPSDHPEIRDDDDSNPANRHGEYLWTETEVPWPCFEDEALQYGRAKLADYNRPKRPARYRIQGGYIRDSAKHWQQGWKPRSSQTLGVLDHPDDRPRLITETPSWDQESKTLEIAVDGAPPSLAVMVARQQRGREAANL